VSVVCVAWKGERIGLALAVLGYVATLLNLLVWQLAALRQGPRPGVVTALATVVLGVVIGLWLLVK
jgi:hypothetical protein